MKFGYRIMMTELCEIPEIVKQERGCTQGFSEAPYLVEDIVYDDLEDAEEALSGYSSFMTGKVTDQYMQRVYGAREFYIEQIITGNYGKKLDSCGPIRYAEFMDCKGMDCLPAPPPVVKWCRRKNNDCKPESCITYKRKGRMSGL